MATLYDQFGRPIELKQLDRELAAPSVAGVRTIWTEQVASGLTPARLARILREAAEGNHDQYLTLAEEMEERYLHYYAELAKRKLAVSRLPITVEAYSDAKKDLDLADAVRGIMRRPGVHSLVKNLMDAVGKGFSVAEILWDRSGSRWIPNCKWREPRWFVWDRASLSELRLRDEANPSEGIPFAPYKFILHTPILKSGIPIRGGLARLGAWAFMCHGYTDKDWMAFAEVFGMPLRLGKYGSGATPQEIEILKMAVANLGSDAAAVFPDSMMVELVEAAKSAGANEFYKILAEYLDDSISKAVLGQTSSSGGKPGKLGEEKLQSEVRDDIRDDDAEQIEETLNRDLVKPFIDLNFGPQENYPAVCVRAVKQDDIRILSEALERLVPLGLEVEQSVVRDKLGLPDPPAGVKLLALPKPSVVETKPATNREDKALNMAGVGDEDLDAIDALVDAELDGWEPMMDPIMQPLYDLVADVAERGGTLQDLLAALPGLYPDQDAEWLTAKLAAALLKARAMGDATDEV